MEPDLVLTGGTVHVDAERSAQALAIRGDRVLAVGAQDDVLAAAGRSARRMDLDGRTVVPGFIDAHVHPVPAGLALMQCTLEGALDAADALLRVGRYAETHPELPWIVGSGWSMEWFSAGTPSRHDLDKVVPDRPAILLNRDGHGAWVNSAALRLAGIDAGTADPADGRIEREPDGSAQGTLHEGAVDLVSRHQPSLGEDDVVAGLLAAQRHLHSLGVTGWQDALVGEFSAFPNPLPAYRRAVADGALTAHVVGALWWDRARGLEQIDDLRELRTETDGGPFRATSVKIMLDGVAENFTAGMLDPYLDACGCPTANTGLSHVDPQVLDEAVVRLDALGFQVHFHALGDRAVRQALDAVAAARRANGARDNRHHLAHLQVVHPDDVPRFGELGATANVQALWAVHERQMDELTIPFLGAERAARQYPFADLLATGARMCAGSDWPVSSANPLDAMHVAVNRRAPGKRTGPAFLPGQSLSARQFLDAYTAGSAWINHAEHETGRLDVGMLADFAVLDGDPLTVAPDRIGDTRVTATYVSGRAVFTADR
ncbi:amidohydrolase [Pseudonocardia sp. TRM90224]|uniref:amidohydrolase n=1 Tax=Pseudonocardia sp. TRM90224 TaxID=2812678 RepID=UPI001E5B9F28|nr:amidohydrolase [Pseudonocardia sp. TRM90224]